MKIFQITSFSVRRVLGKLHFGSSGTTGGGFNPSATPVVVRRRLALLSKEQIGTIKQIVTASLMNPDGAMFRNIYDRQVIFDSGQIDHSICGQVNSRNKYGGYTGYEYFYGRFDRERGFVLDRVQGDDHGAEQDRISA